MSNDSKITIVLADDHPVVRQGLKALLEAEEDFQVVAEAGDGVEAVRLIERHKPDVVVADLMMPGLNGLDLTNEVTKKAPDSRVVILSMFSNEAYVLAALRNGAAGYVLKGSSAADLIQAVREVSTGMRYLSRVFSQNAIEAYVQKAKDSVADVYETLSTREREVLKLVAEGHTSTAIATHLYLSPRTVETHRRTMMNKIGLKTQADLIRFAIKRGLIPLESEIPDIQKLHPKKKIN